MTTVNSLWLTIVKYQMISGQKQGSEFKECETTQVENLILVGTFLLWAIL